MSKHIEEIVALFFFSTIAVASALAADAPAIRFAKTQLDAKFRSEGVGVGDFNKDGKMDIAAGFGGEHQRATVATVPHST